MFEIIIETVFNFVSGKGVIKLKMDYTNLLDLLKLE